MLRQGSLLDQDTDRSPISEPRLNDFVDDCIKAAKGQVLPLVVGLERLKIEMPGFQVMSPFL